MLQVLIRYIVVITRSLHARCLLPSSTYVCSVLVFVWVCRYYPFCVLQASSIPAPAAAG